MNHNLIITILAMLMGIGAGHSEAAFRCVVIYYMVMIGYKILARDER